MAAPARNRAQPMRTAPPRQPAQQRQNVSAATKQVRAANQAQQTAQRRLAGANRQAQIERAAGINTRVSPTLQATANRAGFAPGARPGVVTVSGSSVFKDGRLMGSFGSPGDAEGRRRAQSWADEITAPGQNGRQTNIMGDTQGQTFRQLNRVNAGTQTGLAQTGAAVEAIASRGFVPQVGGVDGQDTVLGGVNRAQARQSVNYPTISPVTFGEPTQRDIEAERTARQEIVRQQGGTSLSDFSPGQIALMQEDVNQRVYGSPNPSFSAQTPQPTTPSVPEITADETAATVDSTLARGFTDTQFLNIERSLQETTDSATESINGLVSTDPDILAAQQLGEDTQNMLEQRQQQLLEQYNQLVANLQDTYTAQEADYKEQAADQMSNAISQLAAIGAYGTSTAGIQFVDQLSRRQNAQLLALNANRATALTSAFEAYGNADFELATRMIDEAKGTQDTIRQIKQQQIQRQRELMELKQLERENVGDTITNMAAAGLTADRLPPGYLTSLDAKGGYAPGTSAGLLEMAQKERQQLDEQQQLEQAAAMADLVSGLKIGQSVTVGDTTYSMLSYGDSSIGTESGKDGQFLWEKNNETGEVIVRQFGEPTNKAYEDKTIGNQIVRLYEDGTSKLVWDGDQPNGGYASGGLINAFPEGSVSTFTRNRGDIASTDYVETPEWWAAQCGAWVNDITGIGVGDSYTSKVELMDDSITADNAQIGDVFIQPYGTTGHIGIINGKSIVDGKVVFTVSESNWKKNSNGIGIITHTRQIAADQITGFARPGFKDQSYNFGSDSSRPVSNTDDTMAFEYISGRLAAGSIDKADRERVIARADELRGQVRDTLEFRAFQRISTGLSADQRKTQEAAITQALLSNDKDTARSIIQESVYQSAGQDTKNKMDTRTYLLDGLEEVRGLLNSYTAAGGDTGLFAGSEEKVLRKIGRQSDPQIRSIANRITQLLVEFRKGYTGAAFSPTESAQYEQLLPSVGNLPEVNEAVIDSLISGFQSAERSFYRQRIGADSYDALFREPEQKDLLSEFPQYSSQIATARSQGYSDDEIRAFLAR